MCTAPALKGAQPQPRLCAKTDRRPEASGPSYKLTPRREYLRRASGRRVDGPVFARARAEPSLPPFMATSTVVNAALFLVGAHAGYLLAIRARSGRTFEAGSSGRTVRPPSARRPVQRSADQSQLPARRRAGPFNLDKRAGLRAAVAARAVRNELAMFTSDENGLPAAANMALQLRHFGAEQHLVLASSRETCDAAHRRWAWLGCGWSRGLSGWVPRYGNSTQVRARARARRPQRACRAKHPQPRFEGADVVSVECQVARGRAVRARHPPPAHHAPGRRAKQSYTAPGSLSCVSTCSR